MTAIIMIISTLACIGGVMLLLALLPIAYAAAYTRQENEKETIANNLKIARTNKILADREVLESRRAKLDSEVANIELNIEAKRRKLGLDTDDFKPVNYQQ